MREITIPPGRVATFRREAEVTLSYATDELQLAIRRKQDEPDKGWLSSDAWDKWISAEGYVHECREKVSAAEALLARLDQHRGLEPLHLLADETVVNTVHGELLNVVEELHDQAGRVNVSATIAQMRTAQGDLRVWLDLLEPCTDPGAERVIELRAEKVRAARAAAA